MDRVQQSGVGIIGLGKYLPQKVVTNQEIERSAGLPAGIIEEKTGIRERRLADSSDTASDYSARAARAALTQANITSEDLNLIYGCTFTGDYVYPAMACKVHQLLGAKNAGAFDVMANCTGFQVGLDMAACKMLSHSDVKYSLVLGTALQSRFINWKDPNSSIYFGDGAGAAVLGHVPSGYGILSTEILTNSSVYDSVRMRGGGSSYPMTSENVNEGLQFYELNGMEVWKQVVRYQPIVIKNALAKIGKTTDDVDFFVFHQANLRLIEFLMGKLKLPMGKTYTNMELYGNTAEASMVIALNDAVQAGRIRRDHLVVLSGVGAGFTFGATVMRWY